MAPFPYMPMVAVLASLVSYMLVQMSVFAYAGYMMEYLGVVEDKDKSGYYAGLMSGAFMFGRLFSSHFWGVVADRFGCRLVMVVGLVSTAVLSVAFGCSTTFAWAFIFRLLLGLLNGMVAASKTLVSEVCGKEHETVGMGVVTASWSLGAVLGPGLGGLLSEPAKHHPHTFSELGIFGRHPYLLPNVVGAGLALLSLPLVLMYLKDMRKVEGVVHTMKKTWCPSLVDDTDRDDDNHGGKASRVSATTAAPALLPKSFDTASKTSRKQTEASLLIDTRNGSAQAAEKLGGDGPGDTKRPSLLAQPHIRTLLVIDGIYSFVYCGFDEVFTLWSLSTVASGGLDWSSPQIGKVFLISGTMVLVFELFAVPNLTPRLGVRMSQRLGSVFELPVYFLIPLLSRVNGADVPVTAAAMLLLFICYVTSNAFLVGLSLALNNATGPDRRGELNGISATVGSLARATSPILCSSLFAFSIEGHHPFPFDYRLVFYLLASLRLTVACMGWSKIRGSTEGMERLETATPKFNVSSCDETLYESGP